MKLDFERLPAHLQQLLLDKNRTELTEPELDKLQEYITPETLEAFYTWVKLNKTALQQEQFSLSEERYGQLLQRVKQKSLQEKKSFLLWRMPVWQSAAAILVASLLGFAWGNYGSANRENVYLTIHDTIYQPQPIATADTHHVQEKPHQSMQANTVYKPVFTKQEPIPARYEESPRPIKEPGNEQYWVEKVYGPAKVAQINQPHGSNLKEDSAFRKFFTTASLL